MAKSGKTRTSFGESKRFVANTNTAQIAQTALGPGSYNVGFNFGKKIK